MVEATNYPFLVLACKFCSTKQAIAFFLNVRKCFFECSYNDCSIFGKILEHFFGCLCVHKTGSYLICHLILFGAIYTVFFNACLLRHLSSYSSFHHLLLPFWRVFSSLLILFVSFLGYFIDILFTTAIPFYGLIYIKLKLVFPNSK